MGRWGTNKETHYSFCTKICWIPDGLDRSSAGWWIYISSETRYIEYFREQQNIQFLFLYFYCFIFSIALYFLFVTLVGTPFPSNFRDVVKTIFKRLFRVYAHIYHSHFQMIVSLKEEAHLNTCFKHFILFTCVSFLNFNSLFMLFLKKHYHHLGFKASSCL